MNDYNNLVSSLLSEYENIFSQEENRPDWAVHKINSPDELVPPTIPFIGKKYAKQKVKILVYASAENLANYYKGNESSHSEWLEDDKIAKNRHRYCFDDESWQINRTLPFVHCAPMEDGGLLAAAMFLASKLRGKQIEMPYDFYETIAFGNFGKFSIETAFQREIRENREYPKNAPSRRNIDYRNKEEYLKASFPYFDADVKILKPDYIIMPFIKNVGSVKDDAQIIKIYQMNQRVINCHLAPSKRKCQYVCEKYDKSKLPPAVKFAYDNITFVKSGTNDKYLYMFDYLEKRLSEELSK